MGVVVRKEVSKQEGGNNGQYSYNCIGKSRGGQSTKQEKMIYRLGQKQTIRWKFVRFPLRAKLKEIV